MPVNFLLWSSHALGAHNYDEYNGSTKSTWIALCDIACSYSVCPLLIQRAYGSTCCNINAMYG